MAQAVHLPLHHQPADGVAMSVLMGPLLLHNQAGTLISNEKNNNSNQCED